MGKSVFKTRYGTERHCQLPFLLKHRSAFAKFRKGVAPLNTDIGRYIIPFLINMLTALKSFILIGI